MHMLHSAAGTVARTEAASTFSPLTEVEARAHGGGLPVGRNPGGGRAAGLAGE